MSSPVPVLGLKTLERIVARMSSDEFSCPHCGRIESCSDSDVSSQVVSYWGEEPHSFTCDACGNDYTVVETVLRSFSAVKTVDAEG